MGARYQMHARVRAHNFSPRNSRQSLCKSSYPLKRFDLNALVVPKFSAHKLSSISVSVPRSRLTQCLETSTSRMRVSGSLALARRGAKHGLRKQILSERGGLDRSDNYNSAHCADCGGPADFPVHGCRQR